jgi:hypothetical protein
MHRDHAGNRLSSCCYCPLFGVASARPDMQSKDDRFMQPNLGLFSGCMSWVIQGQFLGTRVRSIAGTTVLQATAALQLHLAVRSNF